MRDVALSLLSFMSLLFLSSLSCTPLCLLSVHSVTAAAAAATSTEIALQLVVGRAEQRTDRLQTVARSVGLSRKRKEEEKEEGECRSNEEEMLFHLRRHDLYKNGVFLCSCRCLSLAVGAATKRAASLATGRPTGT
jgi:hypothetical protein